MPFEADGSLGVPAQVRANQIMIPDGDLNHAADVLAKDPGIAAVIVEASGGSWGRIPLDIDFVRGLRELTQRHGALLIFDEVITGFRWSPGGAQQAMGVTPDLTCLAKILGGGMPCGALAGRAEVFRLCDPTGPRLGRVVHQGTFNAAPPSAAAGLVTLRRVADGTPIQQANRMAELLRTSWDAVLEKHGIAGYVYGPASTFHVYFETDRARLAAARSRQDLHTRDGRLLKGMPAPLVTQYQRHLRFRGLDIMSSTGGVLSASHTEQDIAQATEAFQASVLGLRDDGLVFTL
jgi:glutamate-1-semialdehyde 2,1-aminomutase